MLASGALAWMLELAEFPAALLLGPMLVGIAFGCTGAPMRVPRPLFLGAQSIIGCMIASAITPPILVSIAQSWLPMTGAVIATVIAAAIVGWLLTRYGALPGSTAAWGSAPGGAAAMTAMSEEFGADVRLVAFMQYLRVIIVVLAASIISRIMLGHEHVASPAAQATSVALFPPIVPFAQTLALAFGGAWVGRRLHVPAGPLLVPMIAGALLHGAGLLAITLPIWMLGIAYAAIGWYVGLAFTRETVRYALRTLPQLVIATLLLVGLCAVSARVLVTILHIDALTAYLATSPGGLDSVAIIALGSNTNVSFVLAIQALRLVVVILTGPLIAKTITRFA